MDLSAIVRTIECKQTRFERNKRCGMVGAHRTTQYAAVVGVESTWHIKRQYRRVNIVDGIYKDGKFAAQITLQANPEQTINYQTPFLIGWNCGQYGATTFVPFCKRGFG